MRNARGLALAVLFLGAVPGWAQVPRRRPRRPVVAGPALFTGTWSMASRTTVTLTQPFAQTELREARVTAVVAGGAGTALVFDVTSDRGDHCVLNASATGPRAVSFAPGQLCEVTDPVTQLRLSLTLVDGAGTVRGGSLTLSITWSVAAGAGAAAFPIAGSATQRCAGPRSAG